MPSNKKPSRPFKGNKFLIQSNEYKELNFKLIQLLAQLQQVQGVMMAMMQGPTTDAGTASSTEAHDLSLATIAKVVAESGPTVPAFGPVLVKPFQTYGKYPDGV